VDGISAGMLTCGETYPDAVPRIDLDLTVKRKIPVSAGVRIPSSIPWPVSHFYAYLNEHRVSHLKILTKVAGNNELIHFIRCPRRPTEYVWFILSEINSET